MKVAIKKEPGSEVAGKEHMPSDSGTQSDGDGESGAWPGDKRSQMLPLSLLCPPPRSADASKESRRSTVLKAFNSNGAATAADKAGSGKRGSGRAERQLTACKRQRSTDCLLYTSPSPRDRTRSRMPSSA